jgi:hypothetical protein
MTSIDDFKSTKRNLKKKIAALDDLLDQIDETTQFSKY